MPPTGLQQGLNFMGRIARWLPGWDRPHEWTWGHRFPTQEFELVGSSVYEGTDRQTHREWLCYLECPRCFPKREGWSEAGVCIWQLTQMLSPVPPSATSPVAITQVWSHLPRWSPVEVLWLPGARRFSGSCISGRLRARAHVSGGEGTLTHLPIFSIYFWDREACLGLF